MKKSVQITIIIIAITIVIAGAVSFVLMGARAGGTRYVCVEVNPRVEFLTDKNREVKSVKPINEEAKTLLIDETFVGLSIEEATTKFVDLCARAGYIDINGKDNAVKISVLSGLNQSLEVDLYREVSKYFTDNEIYGVVFDASKDLAIYKAAKRMKVSPEQLDLMLAVKENNNGIDINKIKNKSCKDLIKILEEQHKAYEFEYTEEELANKVKLIDFNRENYENHKANITDKTTRQFREEYSKYLKTENKIYEQNFDKKYVEWLNFDEK